MQIYIIIGPAGIGKTTIGKMLAERLHLPFYDADDYHSPENLRKMNSGIPLGDRGRELWIRQISQLIKEWHAQGGAVLACSALKEKYRKALMSIPKEHIIWIYLYGNPDLVFERLQLRKEHFFNNALLESQYQELEVPEYGLHISVNNAPQQIIEEILEFVIENKEVEAKSEFGLIGLGVMGKSLALNMVKKGISLSVYNRHVPEKEELIAEKFVNEHRDVSYMLGFDDLKLFLKSLTPPRNIFLMVNAAVVDHVIDSLWPNLGKGDIIIDGGNSHYLDTTRRMAYLEEKGMHFIGVGVSGGEEGALKGPSIMVGGSIEVYNRVGRYLEMIAAKDKWGRPCCALLGPGGAGHFTKMVHNGIEYAEMQIIAEIYHLLRHYISASPNQIADIFTSWKESGRDSYLLEITIEILNKMESGDFVLDKILDAAKQKNTGGWTVEAAFQLGVPVSTISEAVAARLLSSKKAERQKASAIFNDVKRKLGDVDLDKFIKDITNAHDASRIINHAIGFDVLKGASRQHQWNLDLSEIARIWTNGCIIRSELMERLVYELTDMTPVLQHEFFVVEMKKNVDGFINIVSEGLQAGYSLPVLSAALNYFLGYITDQSPANLIQAQRDYFGAHTYQRTDRPLNEAFHTLWNVD